MNASTKRLRDLLLTATCVLTILAPGHASAANAPNVRATIENIIEKLVTDMNKGDLKAVVAACAPRASIVDGFPPYAWQTCAGWMHDYEANNKAIQGTLGTLSTGKPMYTEAMGQHAYIIYPVTFTDKQKGKSVIYKGSWTITLWKTQGRWLITGAAGAWSWNNL